jgi:hypothetical protein
MTLLRILFNKREAFAYWVDGLKVCNKQEFKSKLNTARPIFRKQFNMSPEHIRIQQKHINDLRAKGLVKDSEAFCLLI